MVSCVYVETSIRHHERTLKILSRFKNTPVVEIEFYGEVFNPSAQNFRLQKSNPALIIAQKHKGHVLPTPDGYGLGGQHNYYFSHMLNCLYDCRYCFLQGMYRSAHQVIFVNYEDFSDEIARLSGLHGAAPVWFFSGYDCDSLAYEPVTRFADFFVPALSQIDNAWLELRTKSTQIRQLLKHEPCERVVTAFSFTDHHSHDRLEHGVPSIEKRIDAMQSLVEAGWPIGLRFDPIVYHENYQSSFAKMLNQIFERIDGNKIHSVSLGAFRLPKNNFRQVNKLYPDEPLFAQNLALNKGIVGYPLSLEQEMMAYCEQQLLQHIPAHCYHPCDWHD
ncbi:MAG: spore photoproduct lyase [Gammaproteobacteria bacterium]|jgi:spore photoproduct lyase